MLFAVLIVHFLMVVEENISVLFGLHIANLIMFIFARKALTHASLSLVMSHLSSNLS